LPRPKAKASDLVRREYEEQGYVIDDISPEEILSWQWPAKLCSIVKRCGYGDPVTAVQSSQGKWLELKFSSGLDVLIRPRHVEVRGHAMVDQDFEDYLKSTSGRLKVAKSKQHEIFQKEMPKHEDPY
jgi:hypothetical protein